MASKRRSTATPTPQNDIELFLDKLPPEIQTTLFGSHSHHGGNSNNPDSLAARRRAALVTDTSEALRVLQNKMGRSMRKGDSRPRRVALVVDYLCRNANSGVGSVGNTGGGRGGGGGGGGKENSSYQRGNIPTQTLMNLAGFKKKNDLEYFQNMVGNCLLSSFIGKRSARSQNSNNLGGGGPLKRMRHEYGDAINNQSNNKYSNLFDDAVVEVNSSRGGTGNSTQIPTPTNLFQQLFIQLGTMVPDVEYVQSYATSLLHFLCHPQGLITDPAVLSSKRREFDELKQDMSLHPTCYEAVCFYLAVKKSEGSSGIGSNNYNNSRGDNKKKGSRGDSKSVADDKDPSPNILFEAENMEDEGEDAVGNDLSDRPIKEYDVIMAANLTEGTFRTVLDLVRSMIHGVTIPLDFGVIQSSNEDRSSNKQKRINPNSNNAEEGADDDNDNQIPLTPEERERVSRANAYSLWAHNAIRKATGDAMRAMLKDDPGAGEPSEGALLQFAADEVLQKFL